MRAPALILVTGVALGTILHAQSQAPAAPRFLTPTPPAPLFFGEPWRQSRPMDASTGFRPEGGVTTAAVTNPMLELKIYDPLAKNVPAYKASPPRRLHPGRLGRAVMHPARRLQPEPAAREGGRRSAVGSPQPVDRGVPDRGGGDAAA
jgi:hypothetical protein